MGSNHVDHVDGVQIVPVMLMVTHMKGMSAASGTVPFHGWTEPSMALRGRGLVTAPWALPPGSSVTATAATATTPTGMCDRMELIVTAVVGAVGEKGDMLLVCCARRAQGGTWSIAQSRREGRLRCCKTVKTK